MNDRAGKIPTTSKLPTIAALVLLALTGLSAAFCETLPTVDQTRITMTAQDADGMVWAVGFGFAGGVYRWEGHHWARAAVQSEGSFPLGIWKGPSGGVMVAWQQMPGGVAIMWYPGDESKLLGMLPAEAAPRVFSTPRIFPAPSDSLWITANDGWIYHLGQDGRVKPAYTFPPGEFSPYIHPPGRPAMYTPLEATSDGQDRTWFWVGSGWRFPNWRPLEGFLIYDGHSFVHHRAITGLPDATVSFLGVADEKRLWAGILRDGLYSIDTVKLEAHRIPEPEPGAFERITKIFQVGKDAYVVAYPFSEPVAETPAHRLSSTLWRLWKGRWQKALTGIDDIPDAAIASSRPWLSTPEGIWLGSAGAGLWFIPSRSRAPQLVDWQRGFPLDSAIRLYALADGRMLAVSFSPHVPWPSTQSRCFNLPGLQRTFKYSIRSRPSSRINSFACGAFWRSAAAPSTNGTEKNGSRILCRKVSIRSSLTARMRTPKAASGSSPVVNKERWASLIRAAESGPLIPLIRPPC